MANCIFVSDDDLERYSKELGISKLAVHATIMVMTEGKEVNSIPSPQEVLEYRQRNNIVAKATDNSLSEMASIKQKAIANGTFMKAPNGKPTNLTEGQWLQVRTKAFKDWFGDWEKVNQFALENVDYSKVDIEEADKPWRDNPTKSNKTIRIYLKNQHEKGYFELVKDFEFGQYSVHFKTAKPGAKYNSSTAAESTNEDRKILFTELVKAIPDGALVSTWGSLSDDGIRALDNVGRGMAKIGERDATLKSDGSSIKIPIYQKGRGVSKVVDENGEPLVVYHGSPEEFSVFDKNKLGKNTGTSSSKLGFFFSSNRDVSRSYVGDAYFVETEYGYDVEIPELDLLRDSKEFDYRPLDGELYLGYISKEEYDKKAAEIEEYYRKKEEEILEKVRAKNNNVRQFFLNIRNIKEGGKGDFTSDIENAINSGSDGVLLKQVKDPVTADNFVVFEPNQIKSATDNNGEFSRESDNIYYQTEKQLQSIESDTQKLKALNNRTLKSFGSEAKLSDTLKKAGVSPEVRGAILEGYKAMPSIRSLSPLAALQYIASSQYKGLVQQYNESIRKPQDEALEKKLTSFLSKYGFEVNIGDAVKQFGSVTGVLDIINKIIYVANNRNEMTLPEEFGHAFVELLGSTTSKKEENKDFTFLMDTVENTELYKQVFEQYKDVYKREDGTPDTYKIKKEAIGQAIGLSILSQYKGQDNETKTFLQKVKEWVEKILDKFRGTEYLSFENLVNQMAKEILEGSTKRLDKVDQTGYNRLDYYKTIEEQNKRDGGKALEFMKFFSSIGNVITGSLAYRLQGTVYRGKLDALHDIDMEVPQSAHGILMDSQLVANAIQQALNNNQKQLFDIVTSSPYFQKIKSKYPKIKFGAAYADRKKNDKVTVNAVYSEDESLSERFLKMTGSYAERLNNFTEEERSQIYLFDFFLKPEATGFFEPVYELTLATFDVPMREKRWMGRAKDIMDYQNWRVFDEYRGKIQPTEQDLMYQLGDNDNMKFLNEITELTRDLNKRLGRGGGASVLINEYFNGRPILKVFTYNSAFDLDYNYQIRYGLNGVIEVTSLPNTEQSKWVPFSKEDESDLAAFKNFYQAVDKKSAQTETSQVNREISIQERFFNNEFGGNFEGGGSFFEDFNGLRGDDLSKEDQMTLLEAVDRVEEIYMGGVDIPMSVDDLNIIFNYMKKVNPEAYKAAREDFKQRHPDLWKPVNSQPQQQISQQQSQSAQEQEIRQFVTAAPYFRQKLTSKNREELEKQTATVKERAKTLAKELGLEIEVVRTMAGTYQESSEISYKYIIKSGEQDKVDLFAALMADLSFEYQDAVIAANYTHDKAQTNAYEIVYKVPEGTTIEDIEATLKEVGIDGSSFELDSSELSIIGFSEEEVQEIINKLKDRYEYKEHNPQNSRYLDNEYRRNAYKSWLNSERGKQNRKLYNACSKALAICEAAAPYYTKERGVDPDEEVDAEEAQRIKAAKEAAENWKPDVSGLPQQQNNIPASYEGRIIPDTNTVFVFGSNPEGRHGAGAAKVAREQFGAIYGQGEGLQGNAYALPTKDLRVKENNGLKSISPEQIIENIKRMYEVARQNPNKQFKVAYTNGLNETTLNGYTGREMIQMFKDAGPIPSNVVFSKNWTDHWNEVAPQQPQQQTTSQQPVNNPQQQEFQWQSTEEESKEQEAPIISSEELVSERPVLNAVYPTLTIKRDRTNAIARRFSKLLDNKLDERKKELQEQLSQAEAANNDDLATSLYIKLSTLTRQSFLKSYGLKKMFEEVRDSFNPDNVTREDEEKFFEDNYDRGDGWTDEGYNAWLNERVDERVDHKKNEYRKIQENFWPLAEESTLAIKKLEHIIIDISKSSTSTDTNTSSELNEDNSNSENETNNVMDMEEKTPESWMNSFRSISGMDSLSQKTRAALNSLLQLDMEGYETFDDIGENRYMDPEYAHAILLYGLGNMTKSDDFEPALLKLGQKYSFVRLLYSLDEDGKPQGILEDDHQLKAAFYQDFRKDLTSYWASRGKRNPDGSFNKDTTFPLNSKENTKWLLDSWKYNTEGGIQIGGQESAFNPDSTINADAVKRIIEKLTHIYKDLKSISGTPNERNAKIEQYLFKDNNKNWHTFVDILRSIGIDQEEEELRWALVDSKIANDSPITVFDVLEKANSILSNLQSAKYQKVDKDGNKIPVDILKEFTGYYTDIANLIGFIGENSTESSFHHLDKTRYSYTVPNYLGKVLKELKNVNSDEDRFKAYIEDNFGKYQWFRDKEHDVWFNSWIEDLVEHPELRKVLDHKVVLDFNKKGFFEAGSLEYTLGLLREFNAPKDANQAWYYVPMLSDTDSSEFIKFTKDVADGYQQRLIDKMTLTVLQEYNRIKLVRERKVGIENGTVDPIANFDEVKGKGGRGLKFCFFPELNSWKDENGDSFLDLMDSLSDQKREASGNAVKVANINTQVKALIATALNDIIERDVDDNFKKYSELGVFDMEGGKYKYMKGSDEGDAGNREIVSKYIYNSRFATSQIIQIFATDLAYYSDATDFQKRFKEIHAPALRLYTKAEYNGERVGKDIERSIYLADEKILSNTYEQLKQALDERVEAKILSAASRDYILKQYQNINSSDAQAYRTLDSYRAILVMSGQWNDALEQAYNNFQSGNWTIEDFSQIFQTKKPYLYTQVSVGSQVSGYGDMKVGMQHKNSEFLLLAMLPKLVEGTSMQDAFKLRAIDKFMHNPKGVDKPDPNDVIDVVNFTSAVKVGNQGVIDLNYKTLHQGITYKGKNYRTNEDAYKLKKELDSDLDAGKITRKQYDDILGTFKFKDEDEVTKHLNKVTKNGTSTITIHSASYEDYGIQTQTPEHIIDHEQLLGTQIRKLIGADITPGTMLSVGDVNMTAEEWWKVYNGILVDNIAQSYEDVYERFATPEALEQLLVETIKGNDRYPNDLLNAVRLVDELDASGRPTGNKRFNIPLFDLGTAELVESLVNSIIKDNVTKQKIRGGSCIQVSSFGLSDKLKVVYDTDENGKNTRVKYMECYMPAYAKEFYQAFMKRTDDGNYILDMSELPEELRYAIGYRVPTEDKYSMAPLKIVGFLPQQNGSAIMLPAEITTLSGSDFDVDKMYIMLPEFDVIRYDKEKAKKDFKEYNKRYNRDIDDTWEAYFDAILNDDDLDEYSDIQEIGTAKTFSDWWKENKENYKLKRPKFKKIEGTFEADENGKNASFDDGLSKKKNPSRADRERARKKRNNAIIDMMFSVLTNSDTLPRFVKPGGFEEVERQAYIQRILENIKYNELEKLLKEDSEITFTINVSETLNSLKTDKLSDLASKYGKVLDPLSPLTQIHFHKQNSAGAKAIGIYAVNNAGQALLQHTDLSLLSIQKGTGKDGVGKINILGREGDSLHDIRNSDGEYITNNEAQYLAASVDNGKKPTLEDNGQNDFTFNMSNALGRLGFRHREISAIMNQPIIKELAEAVTKGIADGKIKDAIINEVLGKYAAKAGVSKAAINDKVDVSKATLEDFYKDRCLKTYSDMDAEYYRRQLNIGIWFKNNDVNAVAVNTVTQNLRADAQNAAAGPAVVDTVLRELKIESHINSDMGLYDPGEDYTKEEMKEHPLGFMMAFQQYGIKRTSDLLSRYFPQYSESFIGLLDDFMRRTKHNSISVETAQRLFDAAILYKLNRLPSLHRIKGKASTLEDTARYLINEFPNEFTKIKKSEKFSDNPFIKSLKVVPKSNNVVVPTIMIDTTGRLTKEGKHRITQGWESLMYSGDPEAIDLATTLFTYSLVRYAGKYSPAGGFAHLVPVAVREGTKGYIDTLEDLRKRGTVTYNDKDFRVMFMRNNTFDSTLFPRVSDAEAEAVNNLISKALKIDGRNKAYSIEVDSESMADDLPTLIASANIDKKGKIHAIFRNGFSMDGTDDEGKKTRKYFVLVTVDDSHAELTEVEPLGIKGAIQEYFLNNPYGDSVVPKNDQYNKENPTEYTPEDYDGSGYDVSSSESGFEITEKKDAEGQEICE